MTKLKVNVVIAGRTYPLSAKSPEEEEGLRKAARNINSLISKFENSYAVSDKQDVLAMCALQFASKSEFDATHNSENDDKVNKKINELTNLIETHLQ